MLFQYRLQPLGKRDEAEADRWIDVDQYIHITCLGLLVPRPRAEQGHAAQWKLLLQGRLDGPQSLKNVFAWVHNHRLHGL